MLVAIAAVLYYLIDDDRQMARKEATRNGDNLVLAFEQYVSRLFR
jgi:hypothetical protein